MSGRSCSLARSVFFYMSDSCPLKRNEWRAGCRSNPRPNATPAGSCRDVCRATVSFGGDAHPKSFVFARKTGGVAEYPQSSDAAATASSPYPMILDTSRLCSLAFLLTSRTTPESSLANLRIVFSCQNTITSLPLWLQFYLICSNRSHTSNRSHPARHHRPAAFNA